MTPSAPRSRRSALRAGAAALLAALLAGCGAPDPAEVPLLGTLERDRIELVATAAEPLLDLAVREGDVVRAGDEVGRLDPARLDTSLVAARARVREAEASLDELRRGGRRERRDEVEAAIAADASELELARLEVGRLERLVDADVAARDRLDAAESRARTAAARLEQDRARLAELRAGGTDEELRRAQARLDAAAAEVADLEISRGRLTLLAPVDATVEALPFEPGEIPGPGSPVAILLAAARPWARVHVPEDRLVLYPVGTPVRIEADAVEGSLPGCVRFVSGDATFTPHYALSEHDRHRLAFVTEIEVRAAPDRAARLPSGLPVRVLPDPAGECGEAP